jgi:hypothetical protein
MSAQRYPEDFDGIIAGAPAYNQIYISAWRMRLLMTAQGTSTRAAGR